MDAGMRFTTSEPIKPCSDSVVIMVKNGNQDGETAHRRVDILISQLKETCD